MKIFNHFDIDALNNKILILLALGIILILATHLRLYNLSEVYTEYDDVGVLAFHKSKSGNREGEYSFKVYNQTFSFNWDTLRNLEKTYLLPLYVAYGWSYSPGQYVLYPLMLSNDDDYEMKIIKGRFMSALSSIATLLLLSWIFVKFNNGVSWAVLFPVSIFAFSQNSILYAHHMSPYSMYGLGTTLGLVLLYLVSEKKITTYSGCIINSILMYFSYMNILIFVPLLYIEFQRKNLKAFLVSYFYEKKKFLLWNLVLLGPVLVLLIFKKRQYGSVLRGVGVPQFDGFMAIISTPIFVLKQLFVAVQSLFTGFFPTNLQFVISMVIVLVLFVVTYFGVFKIKLSHKSFYSGLILFSLQWLFLYSLSKVPLDQTRHALILFPVFLSLMFVCFNHFRLPNLFYIVLCLIAVPYSYADAKNLIDRKTNNLDFEFIEKQNVDHIFIYSYTLSPLLYFDGKKSVLNADINAFRVAYKTTKLPEKFLFVSQDKSLKVYKPFLQAFVPEISAKMFSEYKIQTLVEKSTGQYFSYNDYNVSSQQNGFYVYLFTRI
jgi:hypothetical protein